MTDQKLESIIDRAVDKTFKKFRDHGALKSHSEIIYREISKKLKDYYILPEADSRMSNALAQLQNDRFYTIIPKFYGSDHTLEEVAQDLSVDISTITRNKKRLCIEIYELMEEEDE